MVANICLHGSIQYVAASQVQYVCHEHGKQPHGIYRRLFEWHRASLCLEITASRLGSFCWCSQSARRKLQAAHANLVPVLLDLKERSSIGASAKQVASQTNTQGLDGLVNVTGIGLTRPIECVTAEDLQEIFDVNVIGQIAVTRASSPLIHKARSRFVNFTSAGPHLAITSWEIAECKHGMLSDA